MKLVIVTRNKGKFQEAERVAIEYGIGLEMPKDGIEKLEIQAGSLGEVAEFSAADAYKRLKKPLIVDDSGLFINALNDFPGVYSAQAQATIGLEGVLDLMKGKENRSAYFECAVSFHDGATTKTFVGRIEGEMLYKEVGTGGFGYDPIFAPLGHNGRSFAELGIDEKNRISHRYKALKAFFEWYSTWQEKAQKRK